MLVDIYALLYNMFQVIALLILNILEFSVTHCLGERSQKIEKN